MAEFIKIGNEITVKPKLEGISYATRGWEEAHAFLPKR